MNRAFCLAYRVVDRELARIIPCTEPLELNSPTVIGIFPNAKVKIQFKISIDFTKKKLTL